MCNESVNALEPTIRQAKPRRKKPTTFKPKGHKQTSRASRWMTMREAAIAIGKSYMTVSRWAASGRIPQKVAYQEQPGGEWKFNRVLVVTEGIKPLSVK